MTAKSGKGTPREARSAFASIEEAVDDFRAGRFLIVVDDEDRENEGDLILAAERVTPEAINFMATHARGLVCVPMTGARLDALSLDAMVKRPTAKMGTPFTVSVDAVEGTTTGISAADRAHTIRVLLDPHAKPEDLGRPGHVFPLRAMDEGVLRRAGHTEAAVDLARLAELAPAGVLCEIMDDDGTMARLPRLVEMGERHGIKIITIADLIDYRRRRETQVEKVVVTRLPTRFGEFEMHLYRALGGEHHVALVMGDVTTPEPVLVRVHSQCLTGDIFHSLRCDCGDQLQLAMEAIAKEGRGVFLYMRQEGRGIGLLNKMRAYRLQEEGKDTVEANAVLGFGPDERDHGIGAQILVDLGLRKIKILTNNPEKIIGVEGYGLAVVERVPIHVEPTADSAAYLRAKRDKLGHLLP